MGMRADESAARARKDPWQRNDRMSVAGREVFDWLPVFQLTAGDVFRVIREAGQSPHWIYRYLSQMQLLLLHLLLARRPPAGGGAPARPLSPLCADRGANRPHPVSDPALSPRDHRYPGGLRRAARFLPRTPPVRRIDRHDRRTPARRRLPASHDPLTRPATRRAVVRPCGARPDAREGACAVPPPFRSPDHAPPTKCPLSEHSVCPILTQPEQAAYAGGLRVMADFG